MTFISSNRAFKLVAILAVAGIAVLLMDEKAHMEQCVKWDYEGDEYVASNICDEAVFIQYEKAGHPDIAHQLNSGETARTGLMYWQMEVKGRSCWNYWMFAVCPVGYTSSIPFRPENCKAIISSEYSCVRKWRASCQRQDFINF